MQQDAEVLAVYEQLFNLSLVIVSTSLLLATLSVYFVVPLFFKDGQTLGKKVFNLALVHSNCVKVTPKVVFIRTLFGIYAIETMFPVFLVIMMYFKVLVGAVGLITLFLMVLLELGVLIFTSTNSCIHDLLSDTVVVEFSTQEIFKTVDELNERIKAEQAKEAAEAAY